MAYGPAPAAVLLLLGYVHGFDQTWGWNGTTWARLSPATSPTTRYGASMAYHPGTEAMLLFGDRYDEEPNDTRTWTDPSPAPAANYFPLKEGTAMRAGTRPSGCANRRAAWPCRLAGQGCDFDQVVCEYPVPAPDRGSMPAIHAGAVPAVASFEVADPPLRAGAPLD